MLNMIYSVLLWKMVDFFYFTIADKYRYLHKTIKRELNKSMKKVYILKWI